jgi:parallel beta helix pectate lyase-like protein/uncharacterized protein DUF1565
MEARAVQTAAAGILLASSLAVCQSTRYVSTHGDDLNSCTASEPCRTIARASTLARPGDTVIVASGSYAGSFQTRSSGTSSAYITYLSQVRWGAKIVQGPSGSAWGNYGDYVVINGFEIVGNPSGAGVNGIYTHGAYTVIEHNKIHEFLPNRCNPTGGAGIHLESSNDQVISNYVYKIGPQAGSPLYPCSYIHGVYFEKPYGLAAENIVFQASGYGIHEWHAASDIVVVNNTVFNNGFGGILVGNDGRGSPGTNNHAVIANNVVYGNGKYGIHECCTTAFTGSCNLYHDNLLFLNPTNIKLQTGSEKGTKVADPMFVNYTGNASGNYHLRLRSPGINRGLTSDGSATCGMSAQFPLLDFDGIARPRVSRENGLDLGAYQSHPSRSLTSASQAHE